MEMRTKEAEMTVFSNIVPVSDKFTQPMTNLLKKSKDEIGNKAKQTA